jgi:hypothetical protein
VPLRVKAQRQNALSELSAVNACNFRHRHFLAAALSASK